MSDDAGGAPSAPVAPGLAPGEGLLKYLAIGRLALNEQQELMPEKHRLVAHNFTRKGDPDPEWSKQVKSHLKAIMKRAGHKLAPGKRIRLKDDQGQYEVHILTEEIEKDKTKTLVFFAVTSVDFPKYHSVPTLLKDLKAGFFQTVDTGALWNGGSVQRGCQAYFARLTAHYATSALSTVQQKADAVREVIAKGVGRALNSVENLEDMDEKAELFEDKSKTFYKRSEKVLAQEKGKYRRLTLLLCLVIVGIVAYLVISAIQKYRTNNPEPAEPIVPIITDSSSSSTGAWNSTATTLSHEMVRQSARPVAPLRSSSHARIPSDSAPWASLLCVVMMLLLLPHAVDR